jgi:L-Ala-D/L-Glu epimerase
MVTKNDRIEDVTFWPIDMPITNPFVVATGTRVVAENVFVRITLSNGICGYGEAAPFPEVGGEDRSSCLQALTHLAPSLIGRSVHDYQVLSHHLAEQAPSHPAARCGIETALLDAHCRARAIPLWKIWGGADVRPRDTDITIPIATQEKTLSLCPRLV